MAIAPETKTENIDSPPVRNLFVRTSANPPSVCRPQSEHRGLRRRGWHQRGNDPVVPTQTLLPEPNRPHGSIRRYGGAVVARVRFVKSAQRIGFSLDEVGGLLTLDDGAHCDEARGLAEQKLIDVRSKLADLRRIESVLSTLVDDCCASQATVSCPLIAALQKQP